MATIVVDKPARNVRAYDKEGKLLAYYPGTIGSEEKPAPSGAFKVRGVSWNPDYIYDPKFAWKGVNVKHKLTIRPGPNNPVGLVWIDLTAPTYGIHGTPEPANIGKTKSHGCIRLTNWDAVDLAAMVRPGTIVKFEDEDSPVAPLPGPMSERQGLETTADNPSASGRLVLRDFGITSRGGQSSPKGAKTVNFRRRVCDESEYCRVQSQRHRGQRRADDLGVGLVGRRRREQPAAPAANPPAARPRKRNPPAERHLYSPRQSRRLWPLSLLMRQRVSPSSGQIISRRKSFPPRRLRSTIARSPSPCA